MSLSRTPSSRLLESEAKGLIDFVTSAAIGLHWVGPDGTILWANAADYEPLGYTAEEYIGHKIFRFHADAEVIAEILDRLAQGERLQDYEARLRCKDGSIRNVQITSSVLFDEDGNFLHTRCFTRDVTAQKLAEERVLLLAEASDLLASALEVEATLAALPQLCVGRLADWCSIDLVDDGGLEPVGAAHVDQEKVDLVRKLRRWTPSEDDPRRGWDRVLRTGKSEMAPAVTDAMLAEIAADPEHEELLRSLGFVSYIVAPIAVHCHVVGTLTLVSGPSRRRYGHADLATARDIASRAAQAMEHARLFAAAQEATRRKDEFLAMLGHELRNPLAAIQTATELLNLAAPNRTVRRAQGVLARQTAHMARLLDDLLDVSRIERGKLAVDKDSLDVRDVVLDFVQRRREDVEHKGLELRTEIADQRLWILGDTTRLTQALDNLISNALKFTAAPGAITVASRPDGDYAVVSVRDTGIGIDPELLPRIFDSFEQAPQEMARPAGGLGLGLAVVKGVADLHGGSVTAVSAGPGTGAEFSLRLPMSEPKQVRSPTLSSSTPRPLHILIVEDNEDGADLLRAVLEASGHESTVAYDGEHALELARQSAPDVVLCDVGLPGMNGYEVARSFRRDDQLRGAFLVALTGYGRSEDVERAREAGFDAHLTKPADLAAVEGLLATGGDER